MADIKLIKPQAGERVSVQSAAGARLDFAFSTADAVLEKVGNDLVFTFDDGSSIVLTEFYTAYTKDTLPEFVVEGQTIAGSEFFAALGNNDLMPAAGPTASQAANGARFREYDESALMDGIDRLDGLDLPWMQQTFQDDLLAAGPGFIESNLAPELDLAAPETQQVVEAGVKKGGNDAEEGVPSVSGKINAVDPEGDALNFYFIDANGNKVSSITTEYGTITIDNNGNYTYTLNNNGAANGLAADEQFRESFTVGVSDSNGNDSGSTVDITIDIKGTNDQPTLGVTEEVLQVAEDGTLSSSGVALGADADNGADLTYSFTQPDGTQGNTLTDAYGTFTLDPKSGEYTYTLTNDSPDVQKLADGQTVEQKITIRVQDEHGAWSEQEVTIVITGTNDAPTVDVSKVDLEVTEAGVAKGGNEEFAGSPTASGKVTAEDVDNGDTLTYGVQNGVVEDGQQVVDSPYGKFVLDPATGQYTYTLDQAASNSLALGETTTETFTITVSDGKGGTVNQEITVTIKGTNDQPTLGVTEKVLQVAEDGALSGSGAALGADADNGAKLTYSFTQPDGTQGNTLTDNYGTFTLDPESGEYTYTLTNDSPDVQKLADGQTVEQKITIRVQDEHGAWSEQEVTIVITGTNDAPTVDVDSVTLSLKEAGVTQSGDTFNAAEHGIPSVEGAVNAKDVDTGAALTFEVDAAPKEGDDTNVISNTNNDGVQTIVTDYGTLTLDTATGKYTYTLNQETSNQSTASKDDNPTLTDKLSEGEKRTEHFLVTVSDGKGGTTTQEITVEIVGTNDRPLIELSDYAHSFKEDAGSTRMDGTFIVYDEDNDAGAHQKFTITGDKDTGTTGESSQGHNQQPGENADTPAVFTTAYGTLTVNPDGTYSYVLNNDGDAVQALGDGVEHVEKFWVQVTDEHGATSDKPITITITGSNDAPILTPHEIVLNMKESGVKDGGNDKEGGTTVIGGPGDPNHKLDITDVDKGDSLQFYIKYTDSEGKEHTVTADSGGKYWTEHGYVYLYPDGGYRYHISDSNANHMAQGTTVTDDFTIYVKDQHGAEADKSQDVKVTIEGTNDRPKLTLNGKDAGASHSVNDPGKDADDVSVGGTVNIVDPDDGYQHTITITGRDGTTGKGEAGHNEAGTDNDTSASFTTAYGVLTVDPATGKYLYTLDSDSAAVRKLAAGEKHIEKFTVQVKDEHGAWHEQEITVDIVGTNDAPIVEKPNQLVMQEDNGVTGTVLEGNIVGPGSGIVASDVDGGTLRYNLVDDNGTLRQTVAGQGGVDQDGKPVTGEYGYLTLNPTTGKYEYTLFNDSDLVQSMREGDTVTQTFTVRVSDGQGGWTDQVITVVIKGTNDTPTLTGNTAGVVEDDGELARPDLPGETPTNPTTSGKLTIHDIDKDDEQSFELTGEGAVKHDDGSMTIAGKYGTLTLYPDGRYSYELTYTGEDLQGKNVGELFAEEKFEFNWTSGPDTKQDSITISITGSNDKPLLTVQPGNTDEVITTDVSHQNCTETGKVSATDIDDTDLSFRIMNQYDSNGNPAQGGDPFKDTTGKEPAPGAGDKHWQPEQTGNGLYGSLTINPDGSYTYTVNIFDREAMDAYFKANPDADSISETFTVTVTDKHGATDTKEITVSVPKENIPGYDSGSGTIPEPGHTIEAEIVSTDAIKVQEDGTLNATGQVSIKVSCEGEGTGHDGDHKGEFLFGFRDANGNFVTTVSDKYGSITINPITGEYTYTLNNDSKYVQELNEGETWKPELPPVYIVSGPDKDGHWTEAGSGSIDVTITGQNDAPIIDGVDNLTIHEDATGSINGSVKAHDLDSGGVTGDDLTYSFSYDGAPIGASGVETPYGALTVNADGSYSFTLDPGKAQHLGQGASEQVKFTVTVTDEHGATTEKDINITITGTNDAPTLEFKTEGDATLAFTEDSNETKLSGQVVGKDVDEGDKLHYSITNDANGTSSSNILTGTCGTLLLNPKTGEYEYRLDPDSKSVQQLSEGEVFTETYTITVTDQHGASHSETITVTVTGTNDVPELSLDTTTLNVTEDAKGMETGTAIAFGKAIATDVDVKDELSFGLKAGDGGVTYDKNDDGSVSIQGLYGILTIAANGAYTYTPTEDMQALGQGVKAADKFTIFVNDGHGGIVEQEVTVNVTGANDAPVVDVEQSIVHHDLVEVPNGGTTSVSGALVATDADGDKLSFSSTNGQYGSVTIDAHGKYIYTLNDGVNFPDQVLGQDKFIITIKDGKGGVTTQEVTIDLTGSNDTPVVDTDTSNLHQDLVETDTGFPVLEGKLHVDDADGDTLKYTIADGHNPQFGTVTIDADGNYQYTLTEGYKPELGAEDKFTVTIDDGHGGVIEQEVTIGITPQPEPEPAPTPTPEPEQPETLGLFLPEGDEDLFLGDPLEHANPLVQGAEHYGTENENGVEMLAADLFPRGQEENMDSLLDTLGQSANAPVDAGLPVSDIEAAAAGTAEAPASEMMDVAASLPQTDAMAEATALAAHKIVLENNG